VIYHNSYDAIHKAAEMIQNIVKVAKVGDIFEAKVVRIEKFGAFVNLFGNTDGLLHISKIAHERLEKVEDAINLGDIVKVKVVEVDDKGRVNVSRKACLEKPKDDLGNDVKDSEEDKRDRSTRVHHVTRHAKKED
ncbi:MAG: S1 RNA-binding domain-containing protein, partial [Erysipelotrichaceae bacterium]